MRHPYRSLMTPLTSRSFGAFATPALIAFSSFIVACSDDPAASTATPPGTITLTDANNFTTIESKLHISSVSVAAETDLTIKWDKIAKDIQCHDVDAAADIDQVNFLRFANQTKESVSELLDNGSPGSDDLVAPAPFIYEPNGTKTTMKLSDFVANGTQLDPEEHFKQDDTTVYMLLFQKGTSTGQGARSMLFVDPGSGSEDTVEAPSNEDCSLLSYSASLSDLEPLSMPKAGPWRVDWTGVKTNGQGTKLQRAKIDRLMIGFYKDLTVADLEEQFLDLEMIPTDAYELKLDAVSHASLGSAKNTKSGDAFAGFGTEEGTWIMGLFCDACSSPAPFVVTILQPE